MSRERAGQDREAQRVMDDAEEVTLERVCALAAVHPAPELRELGVELMPRQARRRGDTQPLTLFDVARQFSRRVPMSKLVQLEPDVRLYLACVLTDAL